MAYSDDAKRYENLQRLTADAEKRAQEMAQKSAIVEQYTAASDADLKKAWEINALKIGDDSARNHVLQLQQMWWKQQVMTANFPFASDRSDFAQRLADVANCSTRLTDYIAPLIESCLVMNLIADAFSEAHGLMNRIGGTTLGNNGCWNISNGLRPLKMTWYAHIPWVDGHTASQDTGSHIFSVLIRSNDQTIIESAENLARNGSPILYVGGGKKAKLMWRHGKELAEIE
jgi:hypothetical protein